VRFLMFDVTPHGADFWFDAFNVLLFVGAFAVAVGTYGSIKMGSAKERFSNERTSANERETARAVADSDTAKAAATKAHERIAELSVEGEQLRKDTAEAKATLGVAQADIAKAQASIADAEARNKEAELKLEQLRKAVGPRSLSAKFNEDLKDESGCPVIISYVADAGDTWALATMIYFMLPRANGWSVEQPQAITEQDRAEALARRGIPKGAPIPRGMDIYFSATGVVRGRPTGVTIVIGPGFDIDAGPGLINSKTPAGALMRVLMEQLGGISYAGDPDLPEKTLRIVVAPKP
jgi:hypothetical protein